jgi:hypothetical protein
MTGSGVRVPLAAPAFARFASYGSAGQVQLSGSEEREGCCAEALAKADTSHVVSLRVAQPKRGRGAKRARRSLLPKTGATNSICVVPCGRASPIIPDSIVKQPAGMQPLSRGAMRPSLAEACRPRHQTRAQGRPGARRPHGPRAARKHAAEPQVRPRSSRPSLRDGVNAYTCSPRGPALLPPSSAQRASVVANLTPAPGCQDHTISPSAPCRSSACENMLRHSASTASPPRVP